MGNNREFMVRIDLEIENLNVLKCFFYKKHFPIPF